MRLLSVQRMTKVQPLTSFETHQRAIQRKEADALAFLSPDMNSPADAQRILAEMALMQFEGTTSREWLKLDQARNRACARISDKIERASA